MNPTAGEPLRAASLSVVADVEATSRFDGGDSSPDLVHVATTIVLDQARPGAVLPVRGGPGRGAVAALSGGDRIVTIRRDVAVTPETDGRFRLTLEVPDPPDLIVVPDGAPVSVVVLLPAPAPDVDAELVDWTTDKNATVFDGADGRPRLANRVAVTWEFDRDPTLEVIWRYVGSGGR